MCSPPHCHLKPSKIENHFLPATKPPVQHTESFNSLCVDLLEGRIILIYLEVDFGRGDGESSLGLPQER